MATEPTARVAHPYDPLAPQEIENAREILEEDYDIDDSYRYIKIALQEPAKDDVRAFEDDGEDVEREAFVIVRDSEDRTTYEAMVSLDEEEVTSWEEKPDVQPSITCRIRRV